MKAGQILFKELAAVGALPSHIQFTKIGLGIFANAFNEVSSELIAHSVCTGFANSEDLALLKALVEFIERRAYSEAFFREDPAAQTNSTDGIAAFPALSLFGEYKTLARKNALYEAIERYVWASWWDDHSISSVAREEAISSQFFSVETRDLLREIDSRTPVEKLISISPEFVEYRDSTVIIFFAKLKGGGYLSGGAAGDANEVEKIAGRAVAELARHSFGVERIKTAGLTPQSFYEKRLSFFGMGSGDQLVSDRLAIRGTCSIKIPPLTVDTAIRHSLEKIVYVHRCLFDGQPLFVGGDLARLCL